MRIVVVDLDFKKELELERQRQLIQKELSQLSQEEEARENITIQKKVSLPMSADVLMSDLLSLWTMPPPPTTLLILYSKRMVKCIFSCFLNFLYSFNAILNTGL